MDIRGVSRLHHVHGQVSGATQPNARAQAGVPQPIGNLPAPVPTTSGGHSSNPGCVGKTGKAMAPLVPDLQVFLSQAYMHPQGGAASPMPQDLLLQHEGITAWLYRTACRGCDSVAVFECIPVQPGIGGESQPLGSYQHTHSLSHNVTVTPSITATHIATLSHLQSQSPKQSHNKVRHSHAVTPSTTHRITLLYLQPMTLSPSATLSYTKMPSHPQ